MAAGVGPRLTGGASSSLLGLWTWPPGADRCAVLTRPCGPRLPCAGLPSSPVVAAQAGGQAWWRGLEVSAAAASGNNSRLRPVVGWRSEAWKLLGLAHPKRLRLAAAVRFLAVSSIITMSAPFFLGRIINVIYTQPTMDYRYSLTHLCLALGGVFLCGAAANAIRVYLMQTSGKKVPARRWGSCGFVWASSHMCSRPPSVPLSLASHSTGIARPLDRCCS